ncbi:MAG TPA: DUF167 domain-containing protein [Noviherbaspirillum sp.]|nr:DUF167 domain-containing protein [Noviherbaspirillum sp.]
MTRDWCSVASGVIRISVQITPNAKKSEVIGVLDDVLKIRLQAQPIEGKANEALVRFLADKLSVPKSAVAIAHGHTNKRKVIEVNASDLALERVRASLLGGAG